VCCVRVCCVVCCCVVCVCAVWSVSHAFLHRVLPCVQVCALTVLLNFTKDYLLQTLARVEALESVCVPYADGDDVALGESLPDEDAEGEGRNERTVTASRHEHLHGPGLGRGDVAPYPAWHRGDATKQLRLAGNDARAT
jgi:hypothetical protein